LLVFTACTSTPADPEPDRYTRLVAVPDRLTLLGPGHSREVFVYGVLEDNAGAESYEALDLSPARARAEAPGISELRFSAGTREIGVEIEMLSESTPYAQSIEEHVRGEGDGFGLELLPEIIMGAPKGSGKNQGSTDVLSLGLGGSITLGFGGSYLYDGPGPDLLVFENAFLVAGQSEETFAEPAVVALRAPGEDTYTELPCDLSSWPYPGCAGVAPVLAGPAFRDVDPTDPARAGGDAFDLGAHELEEALAVRLSDANVSTNTGVNSGFDLDAIALIHVYPSDVVALEGPLSGTLSRGDTIPLPRFDFVRADGSRIYAAAVTLRADVALELHEGLLFARTATPRAMLTARAGRFEASVEYTIEEQ
jgi:hypothetical protein